MVDNAMNSTENQTEENETTVESNTEKTEKGEETVVEDSKKVDDGKKLQELEAKNTDLNEKYVRLFSEFDNFRRRTLKERAELLRSAGEDVLKDILPIWDDFDRAKKAMHTSEDMNSAKEGFDLIYNKFIDALKKKGVEEMQCIGTEFNPDLHEAITEVPAPSEDLKGKIVDVVEKGYLFNGKIVKYAKVIVGK
jgi:molecular chaperone GrpE